MELRTADFDFDLPAALIAQQPARPRDAARLLLVGDILHDATMRDLPGLLRPGDLMVVNDTRVIPARLIAYRGDARIEVMLNRAEGRGVWHALLRNARRLRAGDTLRISGTPVTATVLEAPEGGAARLDFGPDEAALAAALDAVGEVPLPPYITRAEGPRAEDRGRLPDRFRTAPRRSCRPHRQPAFHPRAAGRAGRPRGAPRHRYPACRRRHLPAAARGQPTAITGCMPNGARSPPRRQPPSTQHRASSPSAPPRCG